MALFLFLFISYFIFSSESEVAYAIAFNRCFLMIWKHFGVNYLIMYCVKRWQETNNRDHQQQHNGNHNDSKKRCFV